MRHRNHSQRLSQKPHHAWMMLRNMLTSIILYENIRTTKKRAQALKPLVDNIITTGKGKDKVLAIRRINEMVMDDNACRKIMEVLVKRYEDRTSGFTTITAVGMREGDGAKLVDMKLMEGKDVVVPEAKPATEKKVKAEGAKAKSLKLKAVKTAKDSPSSK